jgi:hypothetical protein
MPSYWAVEGNGIWLLEGGNGGWILEISEPATECMLVDLATLKARLDITDASMDDYLNAQIAYMSAIIANYCERIFCANDYTQTWGRPPDTGLVWRSKKLPLYHYPVNSVASVTVNGTLVDAADWTLNPRDWSLISEAFLTGFDIEVVYNAGFDPIPADVAMSAEDLVVSRYMQRGNDPSRIVRSESVPEVGSVDYVSSTYYQRGFDPIIGNYGTTLDRYRTERAIVPDVSS